MKCLTVLALALSVLVSAFAQQWPEECLEGTVPSSKDDTWQKFIYYKSSASEPRPLIVSLHQWSSGYQQVKGSLVSQTIGQDWNYIHPDFRDPIIM